MESWEWIQANLALVLPLILLQLVLIIAALVDLSRREKVRWGNKWIWVLVILFINTIGPIIYFLIGREDE
jgi:hypothetical protein